jgi:GNAT superfamily N-acetyltransferase
VRDGTIDIRRVNPFGEDASALIAALSRELAGRYADSNDDGTCHFSAGDAAGPGGVFLVGYVGGRPIACGALRPLAPGLAEVKRMYVAPDVRGRGYAKLILAELERLAAEMGYQALRLETADRQPESVRLYERCGYRRIPNYPPFEHSPRSTCFEKSVREERMDCF